MQQPSIILRTVSKVLGKKKCYTIFHCKLKSRDFGFVAPSGSGKTTLIKMIAGINEATKGEVLVNNTNMPNLNEMKRIGYMAQADALYEELSAYENADFIATMYGLKEKVKDKNCRGFELVQLSQYMKSKYNNFQVE